MGEIAVSNRVIARNEMGRFITQCEQAGAKTVRDMARDGAKLSKALAPVGHKPDPRSIPIRESIDWRSAGTTGYWFATARHALFQELGAGPHVIEGSPFLKFFWEAAGRMWVPGLYGPVDIVNHPGNPPQPYLRPAYEAIMAKWMTYARRYYPN